MRYCEFITSPHNTTRPLTIPNSLPFRAFAGSAWESPMNLAAVRTGGNGTKKLPRLNQTNVSSSIYSLIIKYFLNHSFTSISVINETQNQCFEIVSKSKTLYIYCKLILYILKLFSIIIFQLFIKIQFIMMS